MRAKSGEKPQTESTPSGSSGSLQTRVLRARLSELKPQSEQTSSADREAPGSAQGKLGISAEPMTPDLASQIGVPQNTKGLVVANVDPSGPAAKAGIQAGDVIQEINRQKVASAADIRSALAKSGNHAPVLLINRGGQSVFVPVPLG